MELRTYPTKAVMLTRKGRDALKGVTNGGAPPEVIAALRILWRLEHGIIRSNGNTVSN